MDERSATIRLRPGDTLTASVEIPGLFVRAVGGPAAGVEAALPLAVIRLGSAPDNDVVLPSPGVSRYHAEIRVEAGRLRVTDLGSTNGTWVEDVQLSDGFLVPGGSLRLGDTELTVEIGPEVRTARLAAGAGLGDLVGSSPAMRELFGVVKAVAPTHATVLLTGESGTGKEVVARTLHQLSGRQGRLEVFDAAATDPAMVRSDLFGHVKGAFTGADQPREGAFRRAHQGTLFLDEVGELPLELQARLLRVIESREVQAMGSDERVKVSVRLVAATHRDLEAMVRQGTFRADLLHRLSVVPLRVPPLRERRQDLPALVERLLASLDLALVLPEACWAALRAHTWPGNVRELRNVLERTAARSAGRQATVADLGLSPGEEAHAEPLPGPAPGKEATEAPSPDSAPRTMAEIERTAILEAVARAGGNRAAAARELRISIATLHRRLREYGTSEEG